MPAVTMLAVRFASFGILVLSLAGRCSDACVVPRGINDEGGVNFADFNLPTGAGGGQDGLFATVLAGVFDHETPIQLRVALGHNYALYNAAAAFHDTALEFFGRKDVSEARRRCREGTEYFEEHRAMTAAYSYFWHTSYMSPHNAKKIKEAAQSVWQLDVNICEKQDCTDIATPWGLASIMVEEAKEIFANDGWNSDGTLSSTYNRERYADWRSIPYSPKPLSECPDCWQPLKENNGVGFMFRQEHVTPHIGETGRSYILGDEDICSRNLDPPEYDYDVEVPLVLNRTAELDPIQMAEIEFFDSKLLSLSPLLVQYYHRKGGDVTSYDFFVLNAAVDMAMYEATLVVWRQKVLYDKIRPTTMVHKAFSEETVDAYLGDAEIDPYVGPILGREWQPYIRVMPHAEYPSGSSCLCSAFARVVTVLEKSDSVVEALGGPLEMPFVTSRGDSVTLTYNSWSKVVDTCGQSRLNGGMHFTASVEAGDRLCQSIGDKVVKYFEILKAGETPETARDVAELKAGPPPESRGCPMGRETLQKDETGGDITSDAWKLPFGLFRFVVMGGVALLW